jgi:hypothetical protein
MRAPDINSSAELHALVSQIKAGATQFWEQWKTVDGQEGVFHYTAIDTACRILENHVLWSSDVVAMSDELEFTYALSVANRALNERGGVLPVHFTEWFRPRQRLLLGDTWNAFAACFCSDADLLSQWRSYTPNAAGVSIGLQLSELDKVAVETGAFGLSRMNYSPSNLKTAVTKICDAAVSLYLSSSLAGEEIEQFWSEVALLLLNCILRFKNPYFGEELISGRKRSGARLPLGPTISLSR